MPLYYILAHGYQGKRCFKNKWDATLDKTHPYPSNITFTQSINDQMCDIVGVT